MMKLVILILVVTTAFSQDYDELIQKGYENIDNYEVALESFEKAKSLADEGSKEYGKACYYIGIVKADQLEYREAIRNLSIAETILDGNDFVSYVLLALSGIYYEYQDYINALNYLNMMNEYKITDDQVNLINFQKAQIYYMLNDINSFEKYSDTLNGTQYEHRYQLLGANFLIDNNKLEQAQSILSTLSNHLSNDNDFLIARIRLDIILDRYGPAKETLKILEEHNNGYYEAFIYQIKGELSKDLTEKNSLFKKAYEIYKSRNQVDRMIDVSLLRMSQSTKAENVRKVIDSLVLVKNQNLAGLYNIYFYTKNDLNKTKAEKEYIQKLFYYYVIGSILLVIVSVVVYYYRRQIKFLSKLRTLLETKQKKLKHSYDHEITPDVELLQLELLSSEIQSDIIYERLDKLISDVNNQRPIYN